MIKFNMKKIVNTVVCNIVLMLIVFTFLYAGTDGTIRGIVTDFENTPLPGAQVYIGDLGIGAMADVDGNYILLNVPVGDFDITCSMIGFRTKVVEGVEVIMDQSVWLNFSLPVAVLEGSAVYVSAEKPLIEKGSTSKKVTIDKEAILALPVRDVTELYSLQSGVVKVESAQQGIPDYDVRGLEEVHVKGGRSGEIAYMIDGLYIRNPIFGVVGDVTNLNLFAVGEFDWQPGGFNAEYGDAMSAVSNLHTASGGNEFAMKFKYETSSVGALMGNEFDTKRGYDEYNLGFGGLIPFTEKFHYWVSSKWNNNDAYRVYDFDDLVYKQDGNSFFNQLYLPHNQENNLQPYDTIPGMRAFGFDKVNDIFTKLSYNPTNKIRLNFSYWELHNHRRGFDTNYLFWDEAQNELFRDTKRITFDMSHSLSQNTFYTIRLSQFKQDSFIGVRWEDSDNDGYPDWFENRYPAGDRQSSDPKNPLMVPYQEYQDSVWTHIQYTQRDVDRGGASGWYIGVAPGEYNWANVEDLIKDNNGNGMWDQGDVFVDVDGDNIWDGPELIEEAYYRDGSYWLMPKMYVDWDDFEDTKYYYNQWEFDPYLNAFQGPLVSGLPTISSLDELQEFAGEYADDIALFEDSFNGYDPFYYLPFLSEDGDSWQEGQRFGGSDDLFSNSATVTNELKIDLTSQITNRWKLRTGFDYKSHKLDLYEMDEPWKGVSGSGTVQQFSEHFEDTGPDGFYEGEVNNIWDGGDEDYVDENENGSWDVGEFVIDDQPVEADVGEANGRWDVGEEYSDDNLNGEWDKFREPEELSFYVQNAYEVPWMIINLGLRFDGVNYNSRVPTDPQGNPSIGNNYWYFYDIGDSTNNNIGANDGIYGANEPTSTIAKPLDYGNKQLFISTESSKWWWKVSPRFGISHVLTDRSTFTFNYGLYYQTPKYEYAYKDVNKLDSFQEYLEESESTALGNSTMTAQRNQAYEVAFNVQPNNYWAFSIGLWVKEFDQLVTIKKQQVGPFQLEYFDNGDFGTSKGIDLMLENKGQLINTTMQYTYSVAKGNSEYEQSDPLHDDAALQEFLMTYDRTHDFTLSLYSTKLPYGINAGLTGFYQSGSPYTPVKPDGNDYVEDTDNKNTKRTPSYQNINLSLSKMFKFDKSSISLGLNVYNLFDRRNEMDVYAFSGTAENPGEFYLETVGLPYEVPQSRSDKAHSSMYYDRPWYFSQPREINFFIRIDYN